MEIAKSFPRRLAGRPGLVLLATSLGVLVAQVDTSVVSLAVKRIGADLGSSVSEMQWMIDAYNLVYAALLLSAGALGIAILGAVFAHFAGQEASAQSFLPGYRAALGLGGAVELAGALIALCFIRRTSGHPVA